MRMPPWGEIDTCDIEFSDFFATARLHILHGMMDWEIRCHQIAYHSAASACAADRCWREAWASNCSKALFDEALLGPGLQAARMHGSSPHRVDCQEFQPWCRRFLDVGLEECALLMQRARKPREHFQ